MLLCVLRILLHVQIILCVMWTQFWLRLILFVHTLIANTAQPYSTHTNKLHTHTHHTHTAHTHTSFTQHTHIFRTDTQHSTYSIAHQHRHSTHTHSTHITHLTHITHTHNINITYILLQTATTQSQYTLTVHSH